MATVASTYASHVPLPASAHTSGIVAAGVVVGAMVETDCASVSMGERIPRRNPKSVVTDCSGAAGSIDKECSLICQLRLGSHCITVVANAGCSELSSTHWVLGNDLQ